MWIADECLSKVAPLKKIIAWFTSNEKCNSCYKVDLYSQTQLIHTVSLFSAIQKSIRTAGKK